MSTANPLTVTEIFPSIQGESDLVGWPTVFVRLTGCPLRCRWCDTAYAFSGGRKMTIDEILVAVAGHGLRHVCVTGGEPLAQPRCLALLSRLCQVGYCVSLETSGARSVRGVDPRVVKVLDIKAPGSGEEPANLWANLELLGPADQIKVVIADRTDFDWAIRQLRDRSLDRWQVLVAPVWGELEAATLADWVVQSRAPLRLQVQLHKLLWGDQPGR